MSYYYERGSVSEIVEYYLGWSDVQSAYRAIAWSINQQDDSAGFEMWSKIRRRFEECVGIEEIIDEQEIEEDEE